MAKKISNRLTAFILLAGISLLTACGNNSNSAAANTSAAPAETPQVSASAFEGGAAQQDAATRVYTDAAGKQITVPANPARIAAVNYVGDLVALGVKPAETTNYNLSTYKSELAGVESIGDRPVSIEKVLASGPDLIITDDTGDASKGEQLSKVAPTIVIPFWSTDPFAHLNELAKLLGKEQEAKTWLTQYQAKVQETQKRISPKIKEGETALLLIVSGKDMGVSGIRNGGYTLYRQLGFLPPDKLKPLLSKDENFGFEPVTLEGLTEFGADNLFVELDDSSELTQQTYDDLRNSSVWKSLKAVKNGKAYTVTNQWGLGDALSYISQLDEAAEQIAP